ncbi:MAG: hypothetical protein RL154_1413 [Pseudomonadota bacterium]
MNLKIDIDFLKGLLFIAAFSIFASIVSSVNVIKSLGLSPLVVAIILGMIFANTMRGILPSSFNSGIEFSTKKVLRLAIVLYGFRITFQEVASVGVQTLILDAIIIASTFLIALFVGIKILKLDRDSAILIGSGASICGAAAVLATESTLKSEPYKSSMAVATVVLFGTAAMFIYPIIYNSGIFGLDAKEFGIYIGATIHEVAQVVVAGTAINQTAAEYAVVVKMARVMMLAPFLLIIGYFFMRGGESKTQIPWFAFGFVFVAAFNSFGLIPQNIVDIINEIDLFLLTMAMAALGIETSFSKLKNAGIKAFLLAFILFIWLIFGGAFLVKVFV